MLPDLAVCIALGNMFLTSHPGELYTIVKVNFRKNLSSVSISNHRARSITKSRTVPCRNLSTKIKRMVQVTGHCILRLHVDCVILSQPVLCSSAIYSVLARFKGGGVVSSSSLPWILARLAAAALAVSTSSALCRSALQASSFLQATSRASNSA